MDLKNIVQAPSSSKKTKDQRLTAISHPPSPPSLNEIERHTSESDTGSVKPDTAPNSPSHEKFKDTASDSPPVPVAESQPRAVERLLSFSDIETHMTKTSETLTTVETIKKEEDDEPQTQPIQAQIQAQAKNAEPKESEYPEPQPPVELGESSGRHTDHNNPVSHIGRSPKEPSKEPDALLDSGKKVMQDTPPTGAQSIEVVVPDESKTHDKVHSEEHNKEPDRSLFQEEYRFPSPGPITGSRSGSRSGTSSGPGPGPSILSSLPHTPEPKSESSKHKRQLSTATDDRDIKRPSGDSTPSGSVPYPPIGTNTGTPLGMRPSSAAASRYMQYQQHAYSDASPYGYNEQGMAPVKQEDETMYQMMDPPIAVLSSSTVSSTSSSSRRHAHILSEQRRRENINGGFQLLKSSVPFCKGTQDSKATILKKAAEYITSLEQELNSMRFHSEQQQQQQQQQHMATHNMGLDPRYRISTPPPPSGSPVSGYYARQPTAPLPGGHIPPIVRGHGYQGNMPSNAPGPPQSYHIETQNQMQHNTHAATRRGSRPLHLNPQHTLPHLQSRRVAAAAPNTLHPPQPSLPSVPLYHATGEPQSHYNHLSSAPPPHSPSRPTSTPPFTPPNAYEGRRNHSVPSDRYR